MAEADPYLPAGEVDGPGPVAKAGPYLPAGEVGVAAKIEPKQRGKSQKRKAEGPSDAVRIRLLRIRCLMA